MSEGWGPARGEGWPGGVQGPGGVQVPGACEAQGLAISVRSGIIFVFLCSDREAAAHHQLHLPPGGEDQGTG